MSEIYNRVKVKVSGTPGTGTITLGTPVSGFQTFSQANAVTGSTVSYLIEEGTSWEIGIGTYTNSGGVETLSRTTVYDSSNSGNKISVTSSGIVISTASREFLEPLIGLQDTLDALGLNTFYAVDYGVTADGVADDTTGLQAAIDAANAAGGGVVMLPAGDILVSQAGTISSRGYCIILKSGVFLVCPGPRVANIKYVRTSSTVDIMRSPSGGSFGSWSAENVGLINVTINGGAAVAGSGNGFNLWLNACNHVILDKFLSEAATNWGVRIEQCNNVFVSNYGALHEDADVNADGIHFYDTDNVVGSNINIYTDGDDAFIIEAGNRDIKNYTISSLNVSAPTAGVGAGRGILLLRDASVAGGVPRKMENINISGTAEDCHSSGFVSTGALELSNCDINVQSINCAQAFYLVVGSSSPAYDGYIVNSRFVVNGKDLTNSNSGGPGISTVLYGTSFIRGNEINARLYNPADGVQGVLLRGESWTGSIHVDYDPDASKVSPSFCIDMYANNSTLTVGTIGGTRGMYFRDGASGNTIYPTEISGSSGAIIEVVTAANHPRFIGGTVTGTITGRASLIGCVNSANNTTVSFDTRSASGGIQYIGGDSVADATLKTARTGAAHYTNSEEPAAVFALVSGSTTSVLNFGGGTSAMNAVTSIKFHTATNNTTLTGTERGEIDENGNFAIGSGALATGVSNGFLYIPSCAGTPTGTPTTKTGRVPLIVDTTNNKLYFYSGGAWRDAGP